MERSSGVLLHVTSLPNRYGLGTMSVEAYDFVRFLAKAKVGYWQVLPFNHCDYGMSPYNAYSVFAGNIYWIDLREFLSEEEMAQFGIVPKTSQKVDIVSMQSKYFNAFWYFYDKCRNNFNIESFKKENAHWLYDYARFMAIKQVYGNAPWWEFPNGLKDNDPKANLEFDKKYGKVFDFYVFLQYIFFMQWTRLKSYANKLGVKIIGDIAIYSAMDGADVWANRGAYQFGTDGNPTVVSGAPPDAFTEDGQLWNNPIYNYKLMAKSNYSWWVDRIKITSKLFDTIRIDHFRGFAGYWAVPYGETTAKNGGWVKGPGKKLFDAIKENVKVEIFAEDLGVITEDVVKLKDSLGLAGMRVFQFGFEDGAENYLPHNYEKNCVVYLGTHDNDTTLGYFESIDEEKFNKFKNYLGVESGDKKAMVKAAIRAVYQSVADLVVVTAQDLLQLGNEYRMNLPGTIEGNWLYQMEENFSDDMATYLESLVVAYERYAKVKGKENGKKDR